jgi:ABC-2 type transport system permease protein
MNRLVKAELAKLRTTRLVKGLTAGMAAFAGLTVVANVTSAGRDGNPPLSADSLAGLVFGPAALLAALALLVGILSMTGEFRHQTVTGAFLVTPDRGRVVAAKLVASALVGVAFAVAALAGVALVAVPWLLAEGVPIALGKNVGLVVAGMLLAAILNGPLGVGVGALVRSQVAALVGAFAWLLVLEGLLVGLLNASELGRWLPGGAAGALVSPGGEHLPMWGGGLVLAAWAALLAAAGTRLVVRRDIT